MMERWRQPAEILEVSQGDGETVTFADGRVFVDADVALPASDIDRIREGRLCFNCLEPQETSFPVRCEALKLPDGTPVGCFYPIREQQMVDFAAKYAGERRIGGNAKLADEVARMKDVMDYEERHGVILPSGVRFPDGEI